MSRSGIGRVLVAGAVVLATGTACAGPAEDEPQPSDGSMSPQWSELPKTVEEIAERFVACMQQKGWDVELDEDYGISHHPPPEQQEQSLADAEDCDAEIGANDIPQPDITPAYLRERYDETVELHACLTAAGYSPPEMISYARWEEMLLVEYEYYHLQVLAGLSPAQFRETSCVDPWRLHVE